MMYIIHLDYWEIEDVSVINSLWIFNCVTNVGKFEMWKEQFDHK